MAQFFEIGRTAAEILAMTPDELDQWELESKRIAQEGNVNSWIDDSKRQEIPMVPPAETDADADRRINGYLLASGQKTLDDLFPGVDQARIMPDNTTYGDSDPA